MQSKFISKFMTPAEQVKLNSLVKQHGVEYYGLYWFLIDRMMNEPTFQLPFEQYYFDYLETELFPGERTHVRTHVRDMVNTCSNLFKLFTIRDGHFFSTSLKTYLENERRVRRKAGELSGKARRSKVPAAQFPDDAAIVENGAAGVDNSGGGGAETAGEKKLPIYTNTVSTNKKKRIVKEKQPAAGAVRFPDDVEFKVGDWPRDQFVELYQSWLNYKRDEHRFQYKSATTISNNIADLYELSGGNFIHAKQMIRKAMSNRWKGFFKLTDQDIAEFKHESTQSSINDKFKNKD